MNISTAPFGVPDTAPELARRFAMIMAGLGALIARRFLKMPHLTRFTVQLWTYLNRAVRRFHRALTWTTKLRASRVRGDRADMARERLPALPSGRGWLVRELGWEAAAYLGAMETLLAEVATRAKLRGSPEAARVLRPICRMLGVSAAAIAVDVPAEPAVVGAPRFELEGSPCVASECEVVETSG
jgi:hypothetical protein